MLHVHAKVRSADVEANTQLNSHPTGASSSILKVNIGLFKLIYAIFYAYNSLF